LRPLPRTSFHHQPEAQHPTIFSYPQAGPADYPIFETWRKALDDALAFAAKLPDIDPKRIAVVGVSFGGFLAAVQAVQDERVAALVSESAGVSTWFPQHPMRMAPLLIVHSRENIIVPLSDAEHSPRSHGPFTSSRNLRFMMDESTC
jgi:dienelactone hydrolase